MKTSSCKAKGRRACQEVRELLLQYAQDLKPDDIRVTSSGCTGEDLLLSPAAQEIYPLAIECKNQEALNVWSALKQAESHSNQEEIAAVKRLPILFFRRNHSSLYVAMQAEHFLKLVR